MDVGRRSIAQRKAKMQNRTGRNRRGLFVLTLSGCLVCLMSAFLGAQAASPFLDAARLGRENDAVAAQVKRLQLQNQREERAIALAKTNAGIERKARASGWMRPEERRFRIPLPPAPPSQ